MVFDIASACLFLESSPEGAAFQTLGDVLQDSMPTPQCLQHITLSMWISIHLSIWDSLIIYQTPIIHLSMFGSLVGKPPPFHINNRVSIPDCSANGKGLVSVCVGAYLTTTTTITTIMIIMDSITTTKNRKEKKRRQAFL